MTTYARRRWPTLVIGVFLLAFVFLIAADTTAYAGTYVIHNCPGSEQPNYDAGPWQSWGSAPLPSVGGFQASCTPGSNALGTAIGWYADQQTLNTNLGVKLISPSEGTTIRRVRLIWSVYHVTGGSDTFAEVVSDTGSELIAPTPYVAGTSDPANVYFPDATHMIFIGDYCSYNASANCYFSSNISPVVRVEGMDTTLENTALPTANINGGSLATNGPISGKATLQFTATDSESGVRESELLVDGSPVTTHSYANQCPYMDFAACPQAMADSMTLNTDPISNGDHRIALRVTSASGNKQTVDDHAVLIDNPNPSPNPSPNPNPNPSPNPIPTEGVNPPPCTAAIGTHTAITVTDPHDFVVSDYRQRVTLHGHLKGLGGMPMVNSPVEVLARPAAGRDNFSLLSRVTTGGNGRFTIKLPLGTSRTICLRYKPLSGGLYAAALSITQRVRAGLRLTAHPSLVPANSTVFLSGQVLGGFIPELGKVVELQVHFLGHWRVFRTPRTKPSGQFTSFYSFLGGHGVFAFRACVRAESNYPFVFGCSREVLVRTG